MRKKEKCPSAVSAACLDDGTVSDIGSAGPGRSHEHRVTEEPVGYAGEDEEDKSLKPRRVLDQR